MNLFENQYVLYISKFNHYFIAWVSENVLLYHKKGVKKQNIPENV